MDFADGDGRGLCVISQGVYEFGAENTQRREVALTLLRAVGYLGAGQAPTTIIHGAGPTFPTPEAQLVGRTFTYRLALRPHGGTWDQDEVWRDAAEFFTPPRALTAEAHAGDYPPAAAWLRVEGANAVTSAVKRAEVGDTLVVRLYNPSAEATSAAVLVPGRAVEAAHYCDLSEQPAGPVPVEPGGLVRVHLGAKKIVTVKLALRD
jgi:alpha-mannosidase